MPFRFRSTSLPGVTIVEPQIFADGRGLFMETYKCSDFTQAGLSLTFVQENQSRSVYGTLRGLHAQREPRAQAKLVRVVHGEIFDVAVDIRQGSATFGRWVGVTLSSDNRLSLLVPAGYAHGFCVVSPEAEVVYKTNEEYAPELEWGVRWDDPALAIPWPVTTPRLSERDTRWPSLADLAVMERVRQAKHGVAGHMALAGTT